MQSTQLPQELIDAYRAAVCPHGPGRERPRIWYRGRDWFTPTYKRMMREGGDGVAPIYKDTGRQRVLTDGEIRAHLEGRRIVAAQWSGEPLRGARCAVMDLDAHSPVARESLWRRLAAVEHALRVPLLPIRSSDSGGLHVYLFLEQTVDAWELRRAVVGRLEAAGITLAPGQVEVLPDSNRWLRLPLGRQSCILDDTTYAPRGARFVRGGTLWRDVEASVRLLLREAEQRCVGIDDLQAGVTVQVPGPVPTPGPVDPITLRDRDRPAAPRTTPASSSSTPAPCPGTWAATVATSDGGIPEPGTRNRVYYDRAFDLRIRQGLEPAACEAEFMRWLLTGQHHSHVFAQSPDRAVLDAVRDFRLALRHLAQRIGLPGPRGLVPGQGQQSLSLSVMGSTGWREQARAHLTPRDHDVLARCDDPWVRGRLEVLVGLLRSAGSERVTINRRHVIHRIAGGRPHQGQPAARLLLQAAVALGLLLRDGDYIRGRRSTTYAVKLPGGAA